MNVRLFDNARTIFSYCILFGLFYAAGSIAGCFQSKNSTQPIIAIIKDKPIYMDELDVLARIAMAKDNIELESEQGQIRYKQIAPNLYKTLIDIYVMKYTAENEVEPLTEAEIETEFTRYKNALEQEGSYDRFMNYHKLTEEKLKDSIVDHLMIQKLQEKLLAQFQYEPTDREISDYYYQNQAKFRYPNRIRASHIFAAAKIEDGEEQRNKARQRIEQLRKMIGGEPAKTFSTLARQNSENTTNAPLGGDLGFFDRNDPMLIEPIKKVAFSLKEGEVSDIIETDYGYHILWVTDHEQSLEEAKNQIKTELLQKYQTEKLGEWVKEKEKNLNVIRLFDPATFTVLPTPTPTTE